MMPSLPQAVCIGCGKKPSELEEYSAEALGEPAKDWSADEYVWAYEGTLNSENGHFACTPCYIKMGQPSGRRQRWVAP